MTRNGKFGVGAMLLIAAIGYLVYAGVQESSAYYLEIDELLADRAAYAEQPVRVAGRVAAGSVWQETTSAGTELRFHLGDFTEGGNGGDSLRVEYSGIVPDMFAEGRDVIVEGQYTGDVLMARTVMTSCPSKYEAEPGASEDGATGGV